MNKARLLTFIMITLPLSGCYFFGEPSNCSNGCPAPGPSTVRGSEQIATDSAITTKVKSAFLKEKIFGRNIAAMNIRVETINGVVYLSGTADSMEQIRNAVRVAESVNGVVRVDPSRVIVVRS